MCISNSAKNTRNEKKTDVENRQNEQQPDTQTFDDVDELVYYAEEVVEEMLNLIYNKFDNITSKLQTIERKVDNITKVFTILFNFFFCPNIL